MNLILTRDTTQPDHLRCTLGVLRINGSSWQTMERPWLPTDQGPSGIKGASCISVGTYQLIPRETEAKGKHWLLYNPELGVYRSPDEVPTNAYGRSLILIHAANWAHELMGCIAPGRERVLDAKGEWMVTQSQPAMSDLRSLLLNKDHQLTLTIT